MCVGGGGGGEKEGERKSNLCLIFALFNFFTCTLIGHPTPIVFFVKR